MHEWLKDKLPKVDRVKASLQERMGIEPARNKGIIKKKFLDLMNRLRDNPGDYTKIDIMVEILEDEELSRAEAIYFMHMVTCAMKDFGLD